MSAEGEARLRYTEDWYRELASDADEAERHLIELFEPHAPEFRALRGTVLDIGGGTGPAARYLNPSVEYHVIDPSSVWHEPALAELGRKVRGNGPTPHFMEGVGEHLPFPNEQFDAAISFHSLNHSDEPFACLAEMSRVLRPGGIAYLVLEDMVPTWRDLIGHAFARIGARFGREHPPTVGTPPLVEAVPAKLANKWPLLPDHVRITEQAIYRAVRRDFRVAKRSWVGGYLTIVLERLPRPAPVGPKKIDQSILVTDP